MSDQGAELSLLTPRNQPLKQKPALLTKNGPFSLPVPSLFRGVRIRTILGLLHNLPPGPLSKKKQQIVIAHVILGILSFMHTSSPTSLQPPLVCSRGGCRVVVAAE